MTDITANSFTPRSIDVSSDAARARIRKRYRAEARFRAYGIAAILFALAFLVFLVTDIVVKALPAFMVSNLTLDVEVSREVIDPDGTGDPKVIATADFMVPIRNALLKEFPEAADDRRARMALAGLVSSAAPDELRADVIADPSLIGQTVTVSVPLSDDADLFVKGLVSDTERESPNGTAAPSATTGTITILSSANDFGIKLVEIKRALADEARDVRFEVKRFEDLLETNQAALIDAEAALAAARASTPENVPTLEGQVAKLKADAASITQQVESLSALAADLEARFESTGAAEQLDTLLPSLMVEINGGVVKATELSNDRVVGDVIIPLDSTAEAPAGTWSLITYDTPESSRKLTDRELAWLTVLVEKGVVDTSFNWGFFTGGDSREAELAGILGALVGSALTMLVTLSLCLPIGVASAIYLEEFAPKNRWTDVIEVNINNLAAVPSIIFGLLGLAIFLNFFGLPRSAPLVGGLVLALLVLPTIIIAARAALKAVPPSIREAALGVGASHQQAVFHHVLPLAMPGVLTGTIIGMAHALGETAPLLLIGMVAFIVDVPSGITDAATVLPVQIFLWSDLPEVGFQAKTSAAILVLLMFLLIMNGLAILLRKRFERRW
jgi:phosphate transport system permease protein